MHGREHATVIRPGRRGLVLHTLFYANEVRSEEEFGADRALVTQKELDLATLFVKTLAATFDPARLKDPFEERLRALIHERARTAVAGSRPAEEPQAAPPIDILEALKKSIAIARRPPKMEERPPAEAPARQTPPLPGVVWIC